MVDSKEIGSLIRALDAARPYQLSEVVHEWLQAETGPRWWTPLQADYTERSVESVPGLGSSAVTGSQLGPADTTAPAASLVPRGEPVRSRSRSTKRPARLCRLVATDRARSRNHSGCR